MSTKKDNKLALKGPLSSIEVVNQRIASLKHIEDKVYKTTGKVPGFSSNIQTETNVSELIKMYSSVSGREKAYNEAAADLGLETYPLFKLEGGTGADYAADVKLRIAIINNQATLDELNAIKKELTELMGTEDRLQLLSQRLQKLS